MDALDDDVMRLVAEHRTLWLTRFAHTAQSVGDSWWTLGALAVAAVVAVVALRAWRAGAAVLVAVIVATVASRLLKEVVERPRPAADLALLPAGGWAMPSTHAARAAALTLAIVAVARWSTSGGRWWRPFVAALAAGNVVMGVLMVYLGAHWPTDVVAGWALGAAVGWLVARLLRDRRVAQA